jgi:hypothetical protein
VSTYANNYTSFSCTFYNGNPATNPSLLQSCVNVAAASQAAASAALLVLYPNAVITGITEDVDGTEPVYLPAAVTGTTSPANLYSVDFYPSAPAGSTGTAGTSAFQVEQNAVIAQNMQVIANSVAQAEAVVVNYYSAAVIIAIGSVTEPVPASMGIQTA